MNITDFIVVYLQQGKSVEIPGVGTLTVVGQQITLRQTYCNDKSIVKYIAEKECVSDTIAEMMWKNYVDALTDKLKKSGSHEFKGVGVMSYNNGTYSFSSVSKTPTIEETIESNVVGNVKKYTKTDDEDPFNVFEQPIDENVVGTHGIENIEKATEPEVKEVKEETKPIVEEKKEEPIVAEPKVVEEVKVVAESKGVVEPKAVEEPKAVVEPKVEPAVAEKPIEHESIAKNEPTFSPDTKVREEAKPSKEEEAKKRFEDVVKPVAPVEEHNASRERMKELDAMPEPKHQEPEGAKKGKKGKEKKKKKRTGLWILIILLLLLCGGGAYYYFCIYKGAGVATMEGKVAFDKSQYPVENDFTHNSDLIEYSTDERFDEVVKVCAFMDDYIGNFLAARGYGYAKDQMMERVEQYATARMDTLLNVNKYAVRRFVPYEDYIYNECMPTLKKQKAQGARVEIQIELMELSILDDLLHSMILDLNLKSEFKAVVAKPAAPAEPASPKVTMVTASKQGYDIIAGFYTSRASAARMTYVLKNQGCDAYVVEKNNGYYVSMGSAGTRTAAEALMKHIKSWYDGDVVIKKID